MTPFKFLSFALLFGSFLLVFAPVSCYYDNEVDQYGVSLCDTAGLSFSIDIQPIINNNCISCHVQGGQQESSPMTTYEEIKLYTDGLITERINGVGGIMPPGGAMSKCNIQKIEAWVKAGALNN